MSKNDSATVSTAQVSSFDKPAVVDDWENIASDQVQQLTNERLNLVEQQKQSNAVEQQIMNEQSNMEEVGLPPSMINKPIKILRREQPIRKQPSQSEAAELAALADQSTLDERKANYDKIRERIFNASLSEDAQPENNKKKSSKKPNANEPEASTSSDIMIETINHLSNIQMLSEQTPNRGRQQQPQMPRPQMRPMQPQHWTPPQVDLRAFPPLGGFPPPQVSNTGPSMPFYGMPPPQPMRYVPPPDFSRPPPMSQSNPPYQSRNKFNP